MEYEIKNDQYITSSTIKNANSIDAVEGTYYRKEVGDKDVNIQLPAVDYTESSWKDYASYEETSPENGIKNTTISISKINDVYRIRRLNSDGTKIPLFQQHDSLKVIIPASFTYDGYIFPVYEIEVRNVTFTNAEQLEDNKNTTIKQSAIGRRYVKYKGVANYSISTGKETEVVESSSVTASWKESRRIDVGGSVSVKTFFDAVSKAIPKDETAANVSFGGVQFFYSNITQTGEYESSLWSVCSMLGLRANKASDFSGDANEIASIVTSLNAEDLGAAQVIVPSGKYYVGSSYGDGQGISVSVNDSGNVGFSESSEVVYKTAAYETKSAKFTLSDETSPKTKYTVPDTNLLTKVSYVKRYNKEDGSLSTYKQPLFAEIADIIINNSKKNKKTTTIEYIGTDNIQTGDTIFFAKDPSTKYIVTKTYLKANPFFVKTLYAREI